MISAEYCFPYVKKRLRIVAKEECELTPIEVALDEMRQRVSELEEVVFTQPPDAKKLQLKLQVSVIFLNLCSLRDMYLLTIIGELYL